MKRSLLFMLLIIILMMILGFGGRGIGVSPGIGERKLTAIDKPPTAEVASGSYVLAEDSSNLTDESGNKLITE